MIVSYILYICKKSPCKKQNFFYNLAQSNILYSHSTPTMNITHRVLIIVALIILSGLYIVPWNQFGVDNAFLNKPYTLGLDLQ